MVAVFSGTQTGASVIDLAPFIDALHVAFAAGAMASLVGAGLSLLRGEHRSWEASRVGVSVSGAQAGVPLGAPQAGVPLAPLRGDDDGPLDEEDRRGHAA